MKKITISLTFLLSLVILHGQTTIINVGSTWKYNDTGSDLGSIWKDIGFDDSGWLQGPAQLGYGDGDEATVVSYGGNSSAKYPTTYFRRSFDVSGTLSSSDNYILNVRRDDGIIVYINGSEVYRDNMGTSTPNYLSYSSSTCSDDGNSWLTTNLSNYLLNATNNIIAVEIHQANGSSSDISFDLELLKQSGVSPNASLVRGPYLQVGTQNSMTLRWLTDIVATSRVNYGIDSLNLNMFSENTTNTTDHKIVLSNLTANTKYYYTIGSSSEILTSGSSYYFKTSPVLGTNQKTNIWVIGDCGNNSTNQKNVRDQYNAFMGSEKTDVWLTLGDNGYESGQDNEFQTNFFDIYENTMKNTVLWPTPGNHDYANSSTIQSSHNMPYYSIFSMPTNAEAGGVASNTQAFYSYDYANIHFISLDSYGKEQNQYRLYDTLGPQAVWLKQDLEANTQKWTVVYWHHPPYTMGSHNSDTEIELINIRQNLLKILERYHVDLVLCGHSHNYERTKLIHNYHGNEASFDPNIHNLSTSSAKYDNSTNSCPYIKDDTNGDGFVMVVAGSSGKLGGEQPGYPHNAMYYSNSTVGGSMSITVESNRLDAKWICSDGQVRDQFTIMKDVNKVTSFNTSSPTQSFTLDASWIGSYNWTNQNAIQSINLATDKDTLIIVTDDQNCLADTFNIQFNSTLILNCSPNQIIYASNSTLVPDVLSNSSYSTNCYGGNVVLNQNPTTGTPLINGNNNITVTAMDNCNGNLTCTSVVTLIDDLGITELNETSKLKIFPNPVKGDFFVQYNILNEGHVNINLIDIKGNVVQNFIDEYLSKGSYSDKFNISDVKKGNYILRFILDSKSEDYQLIVE